MTTRILRRALVRGAIYSALVAGLAVLSSTPGIADGAGLEQQTSQPAQHAGR